MAAQLPTGSLKSPVQRTCALVRSNPLDYAGYVESIGTQFLASATNYPGHRRIKK